MATKKTATNKTSKSANPLAKRLGISYKPPTKGQKGTVKSASLVDRIGSNKNKVPIRTRTKASNTNVFSIKNASKTKLRLHNLVLGTTAADLKVVLKKFGTVTSVKCKDLASGSVVAEVVFKNHQETGRAKKELHGATADGRVLRAEEVPF